MKKSREKRNRTVTGATGKSEEKELSSERMKTIIRKSSASNQLRRSEIQTDNRILLHLQEQEKF